MTRVRMLAVAVATVMLGSDLHGVRPIDRAESLRPIDRAESVRPMDREALLALLQQRAATGVPGHLDHDQGEALQDAVTAALEATLADEEVAWAATRASFAIVPHVAPVIYDGPPSVAINVLPPLALPWKIVVSGTIEMAVDGGGWRRVADLGPSAERMQIALEKMFPAAVRPGFHALRFRAALSFAGRPTGQATEVRDLPTQIYGITGRSAAGQRVAAFLASAMRANIADFDRALPAMPLDAWLRAVAANGDGPVWVAQWCEDRAGVTEQPPASVCARTMIGSSPDGGHAELWVKVAKVDTSGEKPSWTAVTPTLEGVDLMAPPARSTVPLAQLPSALRSMQAEWPRPSLSLNAADITLTPANPRPGDKVTIRTELRNTGGGDLYGMSIDVLAFDTPERMLLHRRFVRSIPAGDSVVIESATTFPLGYGGVVVSVMPLTVEVPFMPMMAEGTDAYSHAARIIRPDLAPGVFTQRVRASVGCKPGCTNVR